MSTTRIDVEEIEATRSEKLLALVMTAFVLIGAGWGYAKLGDAVRPVVGDARLTAAERAATTAATRAENREIAANEAESNARDALTLAREDYRTALDAGRKAPQLERRYLAAQARFAQTRRDARQATAAAAAARPAADRAWKQLGAREESARHRVDLFTALLRLGLVAALLLAGYRLLTLLRRRRTRYLPLAFSVLGAATVMAVVFATDYVTDYLDPLDLGPIVLSAFGIVATLVAFAALQRWLARRIPGRRVRRGECPFCAYPVRGEGRYCEGCGRDVVGACATCGSTRRIGTTHCGACGAV